MTLPLTYSTFTADYFDLPKVTVLRLLTIVILVALAIRTIARGRLDFYRTRLDVPILAYLGACLIATFHTMSFTLSLYGGYTRYEGLITIANYAVLFFLAISILNNGERIERALQVMVGAASLVAITGIAQTFGLQLYPGGDLSEFQGRVFSTLGNPDFLGSYLVLAIPVAAGLLLKASDKRYKGALSLAIIIMIVCLILTYTRGAWIGLAVSLPVLLFAGRSLLRNKLWIVGIALVVLTTIGLIEVGGPQRLESAISSFLAPASERLAAPEAASGGTGVVSRIQTSTDLSGGTIGVRLQTWQATLGVIRDNPVFGVGLSSLQMAMAKYISVEYARGEGFDHMPDQAHNGLLQVAANTGIIGLMAYLAVLAAFVWTIAGWMRRNSRSALQPLAVGILAAWVGYMVQDSFLFGVIGTSSQFWLLMGAGVALSLSQGAKVFERSWGFMPGLRIAASVAVGLVAIYAGFLAMKPAIADYYMNAGNNAFHAQSSAQASAEQGIANYRTAIAWAPYVKDYREMLASVLTYRAEGTTDETARNRDLDEAVSTLTEAIAQNPEHAALYIGRGATYADYHDNHQLDAYRDFQTAVSLRPYDYDANLQVAHFAHQFGETDRAIIAERTVLEVFPHDPQATMGLASDYITEGRFDEATTLLQRELRVDPKDAGATFFLGIIAENKGDTTTALAQYEEALKLQPDNETIKQSVARLKGQ
ncbi:MAG: O-antigen ligase family protein [Chloroflexi bacterium]|nr:O-antigen ligase family protein [Chloroflexota bacterium]